MSNNLRVWWLRMNRLILSSILVLLVQLLQGTLTEHTGTFIHDTRILCLSTQFNIHSLISGISKLLLIYLGVFSAEDTVNYPSAWDLCCNGNWDESCAMIRIDCRKSNEPAKKLIMFYLAYKIWLKKKFDKFNYYDF